MAMVTPSTARDEILRCGEVFAENVRPLRQINGKKRGEYTKGDGHELHEPASERRLVRASAVGTAESALLGSGSGAARVAISEC